MTRGSTQRITLEGEIGMVSRARKWQLRGVARGYTRPRTCVTSTCYKWLGYFNLVKSNNQV